MTYNIERNNGTGGFCCHFEHNRHKYFAAVHVVSLSGGTECMIYPKVHPTQKPVNLLKRLIEVFTDPGDVVIDPVAGSGTTLRACAELGRTCYGFEVDKDFYKAAKERMLVFPEIEEQRLFV